MLAVNVARGQSLRVPRSEWLVVLIIALLFMVVVSMLQSYAQLLAPSGRMAVITYTMPIWAVLLAAWLLDEPLTRARVVSLCLGALGLAALLWPAANSGTQWGWICALGSSWAWAVSMIIIKRFPIATSPLVVITWQLLIAGACMALGMVAFEGGWPPDRAVSGAAIAAIVYNVFSQALSQILWFEALSRLPAAFAALGVLLVPTVAMLGSMLLLHERPTLLDSMGLLLVTCASANVQISLFTHWWRQRRLPADGI